MNGKTVSIAMEAAMKIFLEGNQPHTAPLSGVTLRPGVNEVPHKIGTALIEAEKYALKTKQTAAMASALRAGLTLEKAEAEAKAVRHLPTFRKLTDPELDVVEKAELEAELEETKRRAIASGKNEEQVLKVVEVVRKRLVAKAEQRRKDAKKAEASEKATSQPSSPAKPTGAGTKTKDKKGSSK